MDWLNKAWRFLKNETNQKTLAFIGGVIAAVAIGGWQFYTHFAPSGSSEQPAPAVTASIVRTRADDVTECAGVVPPATPFIPVRSCFVRSRRPFVPPRRSFVTACRYFDPARTATYASVPTSIGSVRTMITNH